jgi:hypothetical protein
LNTNTGLAVGDKVTVAGVDPLLNGSFVLTGVPGANQIKYADNVSQQVAVTNRSIAVRRTRRSQPRTPTFSRPVTT